MLKGSLKCLQCLYEIITYLCNTSTLNIWHVLVVSVFLISEKWRVCVSVSCLYFVSVFVLLRFCFSYLNFLELWYFTACFSSFCTNCCRLNWKSQPYVKYELVMIYVSEILIKIKLISLIRKIKALIYWKMKHCQSCH